MADHIRLFREGRAKLKDVQERRMTTARMIADTLFMQHGRVTSTDVLEAMRENYPELLEDVDPRFMGCVFRRGWRRIGYESSGSHRRPVSVWVKK